MINEQEITQFITEHIRQSPGMLGAHLGTLANAQFPGVNFRANYKGLRGFIEQHCGPEIEIVRGQWGKDDFYRWRGDSAATDSVGNVLDSPVVTLRERATPWRVFTVPDSEARVFINPESASVQVAQGDEPNPELPFVEVPKLTNEEHRGIATDFLSQIDMNDRGQFHQILQTEDFWQRWFAVTRTWEGGKYLKPWLAFRFDAICKLFRQRLGSLGLTDNVVDACLEKLKRSKAADRPVPTASNRTRSPSQNLSTPLRDIARAALEALSEEELRRIWLPLGVVADAVRGRETQ